MSRLGVLSVLAGVAVGAVEGFVTQWVNLLIIFPVAVGLAAGAVAGGQVRTRKIRAPLAAASLALLAGFAGQLSVHVVDYARFRIEVVGGMKDRIAELVAERRDDPEALKEVKALDPDQMLDAQLQEETGARGFAGYLHVRAAQGVTIKRATSRDEGPKVSGFGTWLLWLAEFLLAGGLGAAMAWERAAKPFCEACRRWYDVDLVLATGSAEKKTWKGVRTALDARDWATALSGLGAATQKAASVLKLERCGGCELHEPRLRFDVVTGLKGKPATSHKYTTLLRPEEAKGLLGAVAARGPTPEG